MVTRIRVHTEYPQFWGDLWLSLSGGFCSGRVKWYTLSCVRGKNGSDCDEVLGAILANWIVKIDLVKYLEFVHTSIKISFEDSWRLARICIFSVVSCEWNVTFTPRPPLHHTFTSNTVCPTGSLQTCQWRLPGPHPRIELTSVRCRLNAPSSFTPHVYIKYCMSYRIVTDMSARTSRAPPENRTHASTLRFSRLYRLENKISMFCGISGSWRSDVLVSELLYKKQNLIGVFWLNAGHVKNLLTIHSEFASWGRGEGVGGWEEREFTWK